MNEFYRALQKKYMKKSVEKTNGYQDALNLHLASVGKVMNTQNRNSERTMVFSIRSFMILHQLVLSLFDLSGVINGARRLVRAQW